MTLDYGDDDHESHILCIRGQVAQSEFRLQRLLADVQPLVPQLGRIHAHHCYFALTASALTETEGQRLARLIDGENDFSFNPVQPDSILVVPRFGTVSAWSSKATEIVHRCGLEALERIERGTVWTLDCSSPISEEQKALLHPHLHDRMVESVLTDETQIDLIFNRSARRQTQYIDVSENGLENLQAASDQYGLALTDSELAYVLDWYENQQRNPTDAELMMFSQVNSEHCRHKIFNASWTIDGEEFSESMFSMIRKTHESNPELTLAAYEDNSAVIKGHRASRFASSEKHQGYGYSTERAHIVFKAETHNHPTAISPFPGAATGAGGEIRDEGATGRGGKPKAGLCGYTVSHLRIPGFEQSWEDPLLAPDRIVSPLQIMLEAPIGAASFNNEFGRPNIGGYFRTFETLRQAGQTWYGYHKPIMFAAGLGNIRRRHIKKKKLKPGDVLVVIGGPAMLIGLGGGAASSLGQGKSGEDLDFASVQRSNPEMQRRCQEVIDRCVALGRKNPIVSIHDVGAGGLSNAIPEIVHASDLGAQIILSRIPNDDQAMNPMEIWCNEAQERYVLAVSNDQMERFGDMCRKEHCPYAVVGVATRRRNLRVVDQFADPPPSRRQPVNVDMDFLMKGFLKIHRRDQRRQLEIGGSESAQQFDFADSVERVLRFPSVSDKSFLINIGDRTVTGLIHRDSMVGPWQVPVADAAVTLSSHKGFTGEAMAIGERSPIALVNAPASARMAIGEALTNLRSSSVDRLENVRLSANWMASANTPGQGSDLYESVRSVALDLCQALGISIPVGKDSLSMSTEWADESGQQLQVISPMSLVATAFAAIPDVRKSMTPQLVAPGDTALLLVDLGENQNRMGMSVLHQTHNLITDDVPDVESASKLKSFFNVVRDLKTHDGLLLAYHDRSDGGLFATLCEMAFAGRSGLDVRVGEECDPIGFFFNEELGAVIQVLEKNVKYVLHRFGQHGLGGLARQIGTVTDGDSIEIRVGDKLIYSRSRQELHRIWSELSWHIQLIRDHPDCAQQEYDRILDSDDPGLCRSTADNPVDILEIEVAGETDGSEDPLYPLFSIGTVQPRVAILRDQGVNGHIEMAAAFDRVGFGAEDVLMSDLVEGVTHLNDYRGIALCGGFSFGDVLGAGKGWASSILYQDELRDMFETFFADTSKFALGVCNGCQVLAELRSIIPGTGHWPRFLRNHSQQFEARLVMVEVSNGNSILTAGLQGLHLPVAVAHGEGRAVFADSAHGERMLADGQVCMRYTDNHEQLTMQYPSNPNGSEYSIAGITNSDGRITAMMPHPERVVRSAQLSWAPDSWGDDSPWLNLFINARNWSNRV